MCTSPKEFNGYLVACKTCDQCLNTRLQEWVVRCMAEKATAGHALAFTLSYKNLPSGETPLGARTFVYRDVVLFKKAVAEAYYRKYKARTEFSWIVCGETGSRRGRVHWHAVLFSKNPLSELGDWSNYYTGEKYDEMPLEKRCTWSLWKKGLVFVQRPDAAGMAYCLVYGMKDQFGVKKAKGNARETKAENYAAGKFRMSKHPPIGVRYLEALAATWRQERRVPPTLQIKVPDYNGYWWPKGKIREGILRECWEINEQIRSETGRDAPQWKSLMASVSQYEKDEEMLTYGEIDKKTPEERAQEIADFQDEISARRTAAAYKQRLWRVAKKCGGARPCSDCYNWGTQDQRDYYDAQWARAVLEWSGEGKPGRFEDWQRRKCRPNANCARIRSKDQSVRRECWREFQNFKRLVQLEPDYRNFGGET